ncbi:MAG TPA: amidohydrolase family protein [Streptosporangiales bacterium]
MTGTGAGCDAHAHVLDRAVPSTVPGAAYPAFDAPGSAFLAHLDALGLAYGVAVNPSTYGTDHRVLLDALRRYPDRLRGVAVVPADAPDTELDELHDAGVRGCRAQDLFPGGVPLTDLSELARRLGPRGWHVQVWTDVTDTFELLLRAAKEERAALVVDHLGFTPAPEPGERDAAAPLLRELLATGNVWVKLSGAYRMAAGETETEAARRLLPRVEAVLDAAPDRLVWGSDWPYVACPGPRPTDADHAAVLDTWLPDPALRHRVLVKNPARLYGLPPADR